MQLILKSPSVIVSRMMNKTSVSTETEEQWRIIAESQGYYAVSNLGRIKRLYPDQDGEGWRLLKLTPFGKGYIKVNLSIKGQILQRLVHILVAQTWLGPPPSARYVVNHKDGIKTNCCASNLEYNTSAENNKHAYQTLGKKPPMGTRDFAISEETKTEIKKRYAAGGVKQSELAKEFSVTQSRISGIIHEERYARGEKRHRLTPETVREIRKMREEGNTAISIAREFDMHESSIRRITKEKSWANIK